MGEATISMSSECAEWVYELMHLDGHVEMVTGVRESKESGRLLCEGCDCEFQLYASFEEVKVWAYLPAQMKDLTNILEIRLPSPFGDHIYGTPLLWRSTTGLESHWRRQAGSHSQNCQNA